MESNNPGITFRQPKISGSSHPQQENREPQKGVTGGSKSTVGAGISAKELPPTLYLEEYGRPQLAEIVGISNVFDEMPEEVKENADYIDAIFRKLVRKKEYENSRIAYEAFFRKLVRLTGTEFAPVDMKLKKIVDFIRTTNKYGNTKNKS